ncbi:unnamed protein product [Notodromas monacha]|uniref:Uncharacterized protein n=1 Tax=Notodromas monacha TaxID=399045 RepID=A0A7R9G9L0_9CRUS|nr:unnamed protein product [Notodromas monacha]CAG0913013.1 unnamed protein product [Notodromas monacha]
MAAVFIKRPLLVSHRKKGEFCLDLFQPSGHGRRRRSLLTNDSSLTRNDTEDPWSWLDLDPSIIQKHVPADLWTPEFEEQLMSAKRMFQNKTAERDRRGPSKDIGQNIGVRVILPGDEYYHSQSIIPLTCDTYLVVAAIMGAMLLLSAIIMCYLATRLSRLRTKREVASLDKSLHFHRTSYDTGCPG